jgi:predicted short-subunit dehydrogenase-like oxidoreductase (DUF2520 family)
MKATGAFGLIGSGRVGTVLAAALVKAGHSLTGIWDTSSAAIARAVLVLGEIPAARSATDIVNNAFLTLIAVPDDRIRDVVDTLAAEKTQWRGRTVVHVSGRYGCAILDPIEALGGNTIAIHPAMAFAGDAEVDLSRVPGVRFAVTGCNFAAQELGASLVADIGGVPLHIDEVNRALYHAALTHGSNHLVTLILQADQMLREAGVDATASVLRPLLEAALDNALTKGPGGATGPVVRGDAGTVAEHIDTLRRRLPVALPAYESLTAAGIAIAQSAGRISSVQAARLYQCLPAVLRGN